jgi:next-to-BRCA1 protein 1
VFPITQNYYLSKLLFSPDAAQSSRILLGKEVHNAFDYHRCIRQFTDRAWQHALLRFTVLDEVPFVFPLNGKYLYFYTFFVCVLKHFILSDAETSRLTSSNVAGSGRSMSVSQRPAVPPPMKPFVSFQMPMDVDTMMTESSCRSNTYGRPQYPVSQHQLPAQAPYVCCSVSQGKAEIKAMLHNFQEDLIRVMSNNFDESLLSTSSKPISQVDGPTSSPPPFLCSSCIQHRQGTWYSCNNCHVVVVRIYDL